MRGWACAPSSGSVGVAQVVGLFGADFGVGFLAFLAAIVGEFGGGGFRSVLRRPAPRCRRPGFSAFSPSASSSPPWSSSSSPMRRSFRMVRVSRAKAFWSRSAVASLARSLPARSSMKGRHRSTAACERGRRRFAGQLLAHHQAHHIGQRRFVARCAPWPGRACTSRCSSCAARLCGDAFHRQRADGFHPRLFGGFEDGGGVGRGGPELVVDLLVVIGLAQGIGIARAAHQGDFMGRQIAGGRGQARFQALERRRLGGEIDFQLRLARQRAHRVGDGALEGLGRVFRFRPRGFPIN